MLIQKRNAWEQWNALQCIKETEAYQKNGNLNPYWTELWHIQPTGTFNTSTDCREITIPTDPIHMKRLQDEWPSSWRWSATGSHITWETCCLSCASTPVSVDLCILCLPTQGHSQSELPCPQWLGWSEYLRSAVGTISSMWAPNYTGAWYYSHSKVLSLVEMKGSIFEQKNPYIHTYTADQGSSSEPLNEFNIRPRGNLMQEIW